MPRRDMETARRLTRPMLIAAILAALVLGLLIGIAAVADRMFGAPDPETNATSSLESMRAQNRLKIGRASCRDRVCQSMYISLRAVSLKNKQTQTQKQKH